MRFNRLIQFLDASDEYVMTELEDEPEAGPMDDEELEPSLGFLDRPVNRERIGRGQTDRWLFDCEFDNSDDEPSLGSIEGGSQLAWADGSKEDREDDAGDSPERDPAEDGIADEDGLREQCGRDVL